MPTTSSLGKGYFGTTDGWVFNIIEGKLLILFRDLFHNPPVGELGPGKPQLPSNPGFGEENAPRYFSDAYARLLT